MTAPPATAAGGDRAHGSPPRRPGLPLPRLRLAAAPRAAARFAAVTGTVLLLASLLTFGLGALSDANPAASLLGENATAHDIARVQAQFGLDRPLYEQYLGWLGGALTGDLGVSWFTGVPVADSIAEALPVDLSIAGLALALAVLIGAGAGIAAALNAGGRLDRAVTLVCSALATLPPFLIGIGLIVVLAVWAHALPTGGFVPLEDGAGDWLRYAFLPALSLSLDAAAGIARQLRTSLVGALRENYVTGAEMRGFSARRVLFGHVLRNAAGPALTVLGVSVPLIMGGAVVTEKIFNLPGIAQLALDSAEQHDIPVIQGTLLVTVAVVLAANVVINALLAVLNPAARRGGSPTGAAKGPAGGGKGGAR